MKTISMLELRKNSDSIVSSLRAGVGFILSYRGKALARIEPLRDKEVKPFAQDPLCLATSEACCSPLGELDHNSIDKLLYS